MPFEHSVNAGVVTTHVELLQRVRGLVSSCDARLVRSVVKRLGDKLGEEPDSPRYTFTELGVGCRRPKGGQEPPPN